MSKMSPLRRKILTAMASEYGRWFRIIAGPVIIVGAVISGGWAYLFIVLGLMMFVFGVTNFCPVRGMLAKDDITAAFNTSFNNVGVLGKSATKPARKAR
jgi:hypothetical protein